MDPQDKAPTGGAGNTVLREQDEKQILDATVASVPVQTVGWQADDSHINAQFREQDI